MKEISAFQQEVIQILGLKEEEIAPLSLEEEEILYTKAFSAYEKKEYRTAAKLFTQLILTDPHSEHYWKGLAGSQQMAREYIASLHAWAMTSLLTPSDPMPHYHAAECYLNVGEWEDACKALDAAQDLCSEDSPLLENIQLLKAEHVAHC